MIERKLIAAIEPRLVTEGAGVLLRRSFSPRISNLYDPFLLFDHFAFNDPQEDPHPGFPTHPHRGIETVTYILTGSVRHCDSIGNVGTIGSGDVQWMTAGGGILHEEMPQRGPTGEIYGFQLWVNLPARLKMSPPRYQEVLAEDIPSVQVDGADVRVVAGQVAGVRGPVTEIAAEPLYLDVTLQPGAVFSQDLPEGHTLLLYLFKGDGTLGGDKVSALRLLMAGPGDCVQLRAGENGMRFMLMAGAPFGEPVMPYGPFVMNTREEIEQALLDLRNGTFVQDGPSRI